jgi:hypothetical protein
MYYYLACKRSRVPQLGIQRRLEPARTDVPFPISYMAPTMSKELIQSWIKFQTISRLSTQRFLRTVTSSDARPGLEVSAETPLVFQSKRHGVSRTDSQ